jgi:hypothetical protein
MKISASYHRTLAVWKPLSLFSLMALAPVLGSAQQLTPLFGNGAGAISQVASVQVAEDQFVTAVANGGGKLEVIAWYANLSTNQLVRQGSVVGGNVLATGGEGNSIAISAPFSLNVGISGVFTTAAINAKGHLDIIYWELQTSGAISLISEVEGDSAAEVDPSVSLASLYYQNGYPQFMTAIRNASGDLEVSLWYLNSKNKIKLSGTSYAGGIYGVSIACMQDLHSDVVTAMENGGGYLELIQWFYSQGAAPTRGGTTNTSTPIYNVTIVPGVPTLDNPPYFVNAFFTGGLNSSTGVATVSAWNQDLGLQVTATEETSPSVALTARNDTLIMADTPASGGGAYYLRVFDQIGNGIVSGSYGAYATAYSLTMVDTGSPNDVVFAATYRNSGGDLQIEVWKYVEACSPGCSF